MSENKTKKKWYKRWWAFVLYFFILISIISSFSDDSNPNQKQTTSAKEKTYQQIFTFNGNGVKKSEPFKIQGDLFKIKYDCSGDLCQAYLHNLNNKLDLELIMNTTNSIADETIIYGSGEYYINANVIGNFTMIVEDYL